MTMMKDKWRPREIKKTLIDFPLYILSRPFKGFDDMKTEGKGDIFYAVMILLVWGLVSIWSITSTGFIITGFWMEVPSVYVFWALFFTYAPIALICVANWSITSITDGKGKLKEIFLVYCYALFPNVICTVIAVLLSNVVTLNEAGFVEFFFIFGTVLMYFYLFLGLIVIHEFTFLKAIGMVILTLISMMIIIFVLALFVSLVSEVLMFIFTIAQELDAHLL